jgi:hypothetical protein
MNFPGHVDRRNACIGTARSSSSYKDEDALTCIGGWQNDFPHAELVEARNSSVQAGLMALQWYVR